MTSQLPFKAVTRDNNPFYIERQVVNSLPSGMTVSDLAPFTFIACQAMSMREPFDAMVISADPRSRIVSVLDRMGRQRKLRFDQVLAVTKTSEKFEDGYAEIFPLETEYVRSCSPNTLLDQLNDRQYPRVLVFSNDAWLLIPVSPNGSSSVVPTEAANIVVQNELMFEAPVTVQGRDYEHGYVSLGNSSAGEALNWSARALAQFLETRPESMLDLSYEYSEATVYLDLMEQFSIEVNWPVDLETAEAVARYTNFVRTDIKKENMAPRQVIVPHGHPILEYAVTFEKRSVPKPGKKGPAVRKSIAKKVARKGVPRDVQREVGASFSKPKPAVKRTVKKAAKKAVKS